MSDSHAPRSLTVISKPPRVDRMAALRAELAKLGAEQVRELLDSLAETQRRALEVADNGDQKPGVRDLARRAAESCEATAQTLAAIASR
jgi:hypothetical protein